MKPVLAWRRYSSAKKPNKLKPPAFSDRQANGTVQYGGFCDEEPLLNYRMHIFFPEEILACQK